MVLQAEFSGQMEAATATIACQTEKRDDNSLALAMMQLGKKTNTGQHP